MYDFLIVVGFILSVISVAVAIATIIIVRAYTKMFWKVLEQREQKTTIVTKDSSTGSNRSIHKSDTTQESGQTSISTKVKDLPPSAIAPNLINAPKPKGGFGSK
jgi:hypothetical protein